MRMLGIDFGSKRVGVAVSDETGKFALPVNVIANTADLVAEIEKIATDQECNEIVLGESRNYKGEANDILLPSMDFKAALEKRGFTVYFEPEFMTSMQAERLQGKHEKIDASAAALILQAYLDRKNNN